MLSPCARIVISTFASIAIDCLMMTARMKLHCDVCLPQVSFGEMVACDNPDCPIEWFHYECVGLDEPPKGKWYCRDCEELRKNGQLMED